MITLKFEVGDTAYLHNGGRDNPLVAGKVVHKFVLYGRENYVVEIDTPVDPVLEVRCGWTLSDTPDGEIGMFRHSVTVRPNKRIEGVVAHADGVIPKTLAEYKKHELPKTRQEAQFEPYKRLYGTQALYGRGNPPDAE